MNVPGPDLAMQDDKVQLRVGFWPRMPTKCQSGPSPGVGKSWVVL